MNLMNLKVGQELMCIKKDPTGGTRVAYGTDLSIYFDTKSVLRSKRIKDILE